MDSTGIERAPLVEILESRGLDMVPVNARDARNAPGSKTDLTAAHHSDPASPKEKARDSQSQALSAHRSDEHCPMAYRFELAAISRFHGVPVTGTSAGAHKSALDQGDRVGRFALASTTLRR
jgi:hypothetical protein